MSALDWARTGIKSDPNDPADPQAIIHLIGQVVRVSVETVGIVDRLPALEAEVAT
ncbi:MAG: hypothetical protein ABIO92_07240 [Chloroflexia bacterium]